MEDAEGIRIQMTEMLVGQGYAVRSAKNGAEALARIGEELADAVILDLMMPEMDGFAALRAIRGTERTARLPVLILTSRQVTREELRFLKGNHIHQLLIKGSVQRTELLTAIAAMVAPPAAPEPQKRRPIRRRTVSGKPKVLVVEDNPDNLRTMKALLEDACTVLEAGDGREGVEQARHHKPDLILMDLALPVMDGFAALAAIREDETLQCYSSTSCFPALILRSSALTRNDPLVLG